MSSAVTTTEYSSAEYTIPGMHVREHTVTVPLDWAVPEGAGIRVFARELVDPRRKDEALPLLVFLQGGPGGKSPRPETTDEWIGSALKTHRVVLLDQRGTGRSSRVTGDVISRFGAEDGARYLLNFRADSIVADLEHLRKTVFGGAKWSTLGQSYGGFLTLTYLSKAPEALENCYVVGGLAGIHPSADEVYRRTYPRVEGKTARYYARYPQDVDRVAAVADFIDAHDVRLPDGDRLSVRRLQSLGLDFGMKPSFERMHWLFDEAWTNEGATPDVIADVFLNEVYQRTNFWDNPLFVVLQESIYGSGATPTRWAASRALPANFSTSNRPLQFTGEMMFPWMLEEIASLRPFAAAANALAETAEYPPLYDLDRLASNEVPVNAAVYFDDMYVDRDLSLETAAQVGNVQTWVTNEYEHDGIHDGSTVFDRLVELRQR
jgi:pimeloyl-ACP methyl ester carboxylesterase